MNSKKIGAFIAAERKAKNLTQEQLAEKIFVSPKTVSKWENGNGLPDTNLLLPLCEVFHITLNELLSGERLNESEYRQKAEDNITKLLAERKSNKQKIILSFVCCTVSLSVLIVTLLLSAYLDVALWLKICLPVYGAAVFAAGLIFAIYCDITVGSFECRKCGKKFIPSVAAYIFSTHTPTTRLLKCPHCGKISNCKKRLTK